MIERIPLNDVSRDEWLRMRRNFVSASEAATVCGEASYGSLAELYCEKRGLRPPQADSGVLRRGRWGELAAFAALADEYPDWSVQRASWHVRDTERRIAATPDGFAVRPDRDGPGNVQAKVVSRSIFRRRWLDDSDGDLDGEASPPAQYVIQTTAERMLCECEWSVIACLINSEWDWSFRLFEVEHDPALEERIAAKAQEFFDLYLDPGIMPPFEPQRDAELIRHLYPRDDGSTIDLTGDNRAAVAAEELIETSAAVKRLTATEKALKTELAGKLGEHTYGRLAGGRCISSKMRHRKSYVAKASDFRVLRIIEKEADNDE